MGPTNGDFRPFSAVQRVRSEMNAFSTFSYLSPAQPLGTDRFGGDGGKESGVTVSTKTAAFSAFFDAGQ